jgi:uncharacterized protein
MKALLLHYFAIVLFSGLAVGQTATKPSVPEMVQRAESGEAKAQFELGRAYEDGKGMPQDDDRASEWFRKAADQGNAQAQNSLGVMYALGRSVQRDREEAVRWYKKAAKQGLPEAIYNVAISYYNGEGVGEDMVAASAWMMVAQRKGDAQAAEALQHMSEQLHNRLDNSKFTLARLYEKGDEIPQDMPAAVALYIESAGQNHQDSSYASPAQYKLCQLYIAGNGVPQDYAQARSWCKKSGVAFAYVVLARLAEKGIGQENDLHEALELYKRAGVREVPDGYMEAGRMEMEIGSHDEQKKAYFWFYHALKRKVPGAEGKVQEAAAHLSNKEISEQQSREALWQRMGVTQREQDLKKY